VHVRSCHHTRGLLLENTGRLRRWPGGRRTKLFALMLNAAHDDEHYGNVVTYMRLNKMVPPTSRPAK
jgi:hypothetical protein